MTNIDISSKDTAKLRYNIVIENVPQMYINFIQLFT